MKNIDAVCANCGETLIVAKDDNRITVYPCAKCLRAEWAEAYDFGHDAGYENGHEAAAKGF